MKNHAKFEIPDPNEQLSIGEAVRVIQAMAEDMMATERHMARLEAVLERCKACFDLHVQADDDAGSLVRQLRRDIEEVLK